MSTFGGNKTEIKPISQVALNDIISNKKPVSIQSHRAFAAKSKDSFSFPEGSEFVIHHINIINRSKAEVDNILIYELNNTSMPVLTISWLTLISAFKVIGTNPR